MAIKMRKERQSLINIWKMNEIENIKVELEGEMAH